MSTSAHHETLVDDVLNQLTDHHPADVPTPTVETIVSVANDIRELIFPGYASRSSPRCGDRQLTTRSLLQRIHSRLAAEVATAVRHAESSSVRLHRSPAGPQTDAQEQAVVVTDRFLKELPRLRDYILLDAKAAFDGDPAAKTPDEIIMCYPGIEAVMVYRIANQLQRQQVPYLPRMLSEWAHRETGIDIHPGATIGPRFFIDHGTGVVIGETTIVGSGVTLYQGVTLGAWSFPRDEHGNLLREVKRHPTLEDNVTVYSNASILGGDTIVGAGSQIGSGVTLSRSIPANTTVTIERPSLRFREAG